MKYRNEQGFTLVELLVVIAIIGILATISVVSIGDARQKSRDVKRTADIKAIQTALELFNNDSEGYPVANTAVILGTGNQKALCSGGLKATCGVGDTVFMGLIPSAPALNDGRCTASDNSYSYLAVGGGNYAINFCLGSAVGYLNSGIHTADPNGIK